MTFMRTRSVPLVTGVGLGALSLVIYKLAGFSVWMLLVWLAGLLALGLYYWRESSSLPRIRRPDFLAGVALFVVFAPLYLARVYEWPVQIITDEPTIMIVSEEYSTADGVDPFGVSTYQTRPALLFLAWGHLGKWMGGIEFANMRLLHALVGLIAIAASYYLFRQLLPRGWAMFASSVFGLNHAYLMISRLAMRENTAVLAEVVALVLLLWGLRRGHLFATFLGGIAAGLGFYFYHPGRAAFVLWVVFLGLLALLYRRRMNRVPVDENRSLTERVARAPQRIRVVPLLRLGVEDELERNAVPAFELGLRLGDPVGGEPRDDDDLVEPDVLQIRERDVEDRAVAVTARSVFGRSSVRG